MTTEPEYLAAVCRESGLSEREIVTPNRKPWACQMQHCLFWLLRHRLEMKICDIASLYERYPCNVSDVVSRMEARRMTEPAVNSWLSHLARAAEGGYRPYGVAVRRRDMEPADDLDTANRLFAEAMAAAGK